MGGSTMMDKEAERLCEVLGVKLKWYQKIMLRLMCITDVVSYRQLPDRYALQRALELVAEECVPKEKGGSDM